MSIMRLVFAVLVTSQFLNILIKPAECKNGQESISKMPMERWPYSHNLGEVDVTKKKNRILIAKDFLDYFGLLNTALPNLTPRQEEWLVTEKKELDETLKSADHDAESFNKRFLLYLNSTEYRLNDGKQTLSNIIDALKSIVYKQNISLREEMYLWTIVAHSALSPDPFNNIEALHTSEIISAPPPFKNYGGSLIRWSDIFNNQGRGIIRFLIIPYFQRNIPE